tara:strand:- start:5713 stop:6060 length:348 start_codon:yes stop_codon:yes gene_type:complete
MSIDVETEIDERDLEDFVDKVIDGRDLIGEDGVLPIVDGLLNDFILNSTCTTARRFEKVVCEIVDAHTAELRLQATTEVIRRMVADVVPPLVMIEIQATIARIGNMLEDGPKSAS